MEKFQLSVLFKIIGIGSASGLIYQNDMLYIISDNSTYLYEYNIPNEKLDKIALIKNPQENIAKKDKPDFEAIMIEDNELSILGSGSTDQRNNLFIYNIKDKKTRSMSDFSNNYKRFKQELQISDEDFNIEGMIFTFKALYFFNRGNGSNGKNGIIRFSAPGPTAAFFPFDFPKIKNVSPTFTDAVLVDNKIYFLAAAEDTASTYEDGEVHGSIIGIIDFKTLKLEKTIQISDKHKFEGLTLYKKNKKEIEFLLCEDADSKVSETNIYKLVIRD